MSKEVPLSQTTNPTSYHNSGSNQVCFRGVTNSNVQEDTASTPQLNVSPLDGMKMCTFLTVTILLQGFKSSFYIPLIFRVCSEFLHFVEI